jgi:cephalosporin hydroxylase
MKKIDNIFKELEKWISDKGDLGYIENSYNPYIALDNNFLNEEFAIQQSKEEIKELVNVLLKNPTNVCLEIGLGQYGSTHFLWRQIYDKTITIEKNFERVKEFGRNTKKYYNNWVLDDGKSQFLHGYSNDKNVVTDLYNNNLGIDFLFIDGDHSYESVLCDFLLYYPLVNKGGIISFHDTILTESNIGVPKLMEEIKSGKFTNGNPIDIINIFYSNHLGISYFIK